MPNDIIISETRNIASIHCEKDNGYCREIKPTDIEIAEFDCGRGYACCLKAFKCTICNTRYLVKLPAPELT
jgi:hypothetical protein